MNTARLFIHSQTWWNLHCAQTGMVLLGPEACRLPLAGGGPAPLRDHRQEGQRVAQRVITQRKQSFRRATLCARARHSCCSVFVINERPLALASRIIRAIAGLF